METFSIISIIMFFVIIIIRRYFHILYFILSLPGTILHEFSHYILGLLFLAKPRMVNLIPKKTNSGYTLGSVTFNRINFLNSIPVAMAPLFLIYLAYILFENININILNFHEMLIFSYIEILLLISSIPSTQDFKVAFHIN